MRNLLSKVCPKEKAEIAKDLSDIFDHFEKNDTKSDVFKKIDYFLEKWGAAYPFFKNLQDENYIIANF